MMPRRLRFSSAGVTQSKMSFSIGSHRITQTKTLMLAATTTAASDRGEKIVLNRSQATAMTATEMIVSVFESQRLGRPVTFPLENRQNPLTLLD